MMLVDTSVAPNPIEGVGIFAGQAIAAGTCIWKFDARFDRLLGEADLADLSEPSRRFIERYAYPLMTDARLLVLESDNGRFMNHSVTPNTDFRDTQFGYAIADIAAGSEITCDYGEFDPGFEMQPSRLFAGQTA
jgi:SET domain-containing protein